MMLWVIVLFIVFVIVIASVAFGLKLKAGGLEHTIESGLQVLEKENNTKLGMLTELADLALGFVTPQSLENAEKKVSKLEEDLRGEKGKLTISQAELEAVETRLRELEEIERELQNSSIDASKELEMLEAQAREIASRNEKIRSDLESTMFQLDMLVSQLSESTTAVEQLNSAKIELENAQKKTEYYEEQIRLINEKYMGLKKAYDALDIEYAQLYEKLSAL